MLSRLLLGLTKGVDVPARLVSGVGDVVASPILAQGADLLHLLGQQLDLLEVVANARGSDRLGDDTVATDLRPGKTKTLLVMSAGCVRDRSYMT